MDMPVKDSPGLCRCCFSEGCYKDLSTAYAWMGDTEIYADMLLECFDISITQHVDGPNGPNRLICEVCITRLRDASNFKKQVLNCEKKFIDMVAKGAFKASTSEFNVQVSVEKEPKLEPILEEDIETPNLDYLDVLDYDDDFDPKGEASTSHQSDDNEPLAKLTTRKRKLKPKKETATKAAKGKAPKVVKKEEKPKATKKDYDDDYTTTEVKPNSETLQLDSAHSDVVETQMDQLDPKKVKRKNTSVKRTHGRTSKTKGSIYKPESKRDKDKMTDRIRYSHMNNKICNTSILIKYTNILPFKWWANNYKCFICDQRFTCISELKAHTSQSHDITAVTLTKTHVDITTEVKFDMTNLQCRICLTNFDKFDNIVDHIIKQHGANYNMEYHKYFLGFRLGDTDMPCLHCPLRFTNFQKLLMHVRKMHVLGDHLCNICGMSYLYWHQLHTHAARHTKEYKCSACDQLFSYEGAKRIHEAEIHGIKLIKCTACAETFTANHKRRKHELDKHDIGLRRQCDICSEKFIDQTRLNAHISYYHAEKIPCPLCGKVLTSFGLKKHIAYTHHQSDAKSYACEICHQMFRRKYHLQRHLKTHSNVK